MDHTSYLPIAVVTAATLIAAITDVWKFQIANALTLPLLAAGLAYHGLSTGLPGLVESLLGVLFGFGVLIAFYVLGEVGAGDVKLMASVGAWLGMPLSYYVFSAGAIASGVYALGLMLAFGTADETMLELRSLWLRITSLDFQPRIDDQLGATLQSDDRRRRLIPFAAMVAVGVALTLSWGWGMRRGAVPVARRQANEWPIGPAASRSPFPTRSAPFAPDLPANPRRRCVPEGRAFLVPQAPREAPSPCC